MFAISAPPATARPRTPPRSSRRSTGARCSAAARCWFRRATIFTGAIALRSNTILRLDKDASILGSPDFADYPVTQVRWEGKWIQGRTGLIYAIDASNIGVVGPGKIVGNPALGGRPNAQNPAAPSGADRAHQLQRCSLRRFLHQLPPDVVDPSHLLRKRHHQESHHPQHRRQRRRHRYRFLQARPHRRLRHRDRRRLHLPQVRPRRGSLHRCFARPPKTSPSPTAPSPTPSSPASASAARPPAAFATSASSTASSRARKTFAIYIKSRPGRGAFIEDISADDLDVSGTTGGFLRFNILEQRHSG